MWPWPSPGSLQPQEVDTTLPQGDGGLQRGLLSPGQVPSYHQHPAPKSKLPRSSGVWCKHLTRLEAANSPDRKVPGGSRGPLLTHSSIMETGTDPGSDPRSSARKWGRKHRSLGWTIPWEGQGLGTASCRLQGQAFGDPPSISTPSSTEHLP